MTSIDKNYKSKINKVLSYLYDSYYGYKEVASAVADQRMKYFFQALVEKRKNMIEELKQSANLPDSETTSSGSVLGDLHRIFVDLKGLITKGSVDAIINEVKRGENTTIDAYKEVIREISTEDSNVSSLLKKQLTDIEKNIVQIDTLSLNSKA